MYPAPTSDKRAHTDEDAQTQIIDEDMHISTASRDDKVINTYLNDGRVSSAGAPVNTDDLCTQVFNGSNVTAAETGERSAKPVEPDDDGDIPTQVFDQLPENLEPLTNKGKKGGRGGNRAKKTAKGGVRKTMDEKLDSLETQVFDSFVPPAPPGEKTEPFQSDKVADGSVDIESNTAIGTRSARGRMSLKSSHGKTSDLTAFDKPVAVNTANDRSGTLVPLTDDLATQVFDADAADDGIPVADSISTQTFDDVPSTSSSTGPQEKTIHRTVASDRRLNVRSKTNDEDVETQVFDAIDSDGRNAVSSRSSKQSSESAVTGRRTALTAGRRTKKSVGRKQIESVAKADVPSYQMDDLATQVFDTEPCGKPSEGFTVALSEAYVDTSEAKKSQASHATLDSSSDAGTKLVEKTQAEAEVENGDSAVTNETSKSRRLSSRASRGKHHAIEASLPSVPEDTAAEKRRVGRSQGKRLKQTNASVADDTVPASSDVQPPSSHDVTKPGDSKTTSTVAGKVKPARSQAKQTIPSMPDDTSEPSADTVLLKQTDTEGSGRAAGRRRNKKEPTQTEKADKAAQSHQLASEPPSDSDTDGTELLAEKPATVAEVVSKTPSKRECRKTVHKLYTAKG